MEVLAEQVRSADPSPLHDFNSSPHRAQLRFGSRCDLTAVLAAGLGRCRAGLWPAGTQSRARLSLKYGVGFVGALALSGVELSAAVTIDDTFATLAGTAGDNRSMDGTGSAGYFEATSFPIGGVTLTKIGVQDAKVAKLDSTRTVVWAKNFGGSGSRIQGSSISVDSVGKVYLGDFFSSANLKAPALTKQRCEALLGLPASHP
ncbi:MAG: hypothetical protein NTX09_15810 [Verrucomicrobia bacterium]|nr:hypothetical protein [Verrucomicrobiota bacterium]